MASPPEKDKSLESWIWDAACSIRGAKDAARYSRAERDRLPKAARRADAGASVNDYILPLIFTKRLCDVFDDELNRIAKEVGSRKKAFQFKKGDPKNFIPDAGIQRIADTLIGWKEEEKLSRIVDHAELKKNDYNISPSRYIHTSDAETYRPIAEIVEELKVIEAEAQETDKALGRILKQLGI
jgi:type I restriction-modification system DNA methylase subunit